MDMDVNLPLGCTVSSSLFSFLWPHSGQHGFSCDSNMIYTYDNSGHGNDDGKVTNVADNKLPQQGKL